MVEEQRFCALDERIDALQRMQDEREDRNKERFSLFERNINLALTAADKAVTKAEAASEKRFEGVNELRGALQDQAALLLTKAEFYAQHSALVDVVSKVERRLANVENSYANLQGRIWAVSAIWGILILGVSIAVRFIH